jgi:hypothetical protein
VITLLKSSSFSADPTAELRRTALEKINLAIFIEGAPVFDSFRFILA